MSDRDPALNRRAFYCPHCHAYSQQKWFAGGLVEPGCRPETCSLLLENTSIAICIHCHHFSVWLYGQMVYPEHLPSVEPNEGMPEDVKEDFEEARSIATKSPRGAAALLRLCVQKLCITLGDDGNDLYTAIGNLVHKGLNPKVQQSLDIVRVIGNDAVHPGELDMKDDFETATALFELVNLIVEQMITTPNKVKTIYESLPETKLKAIETRDGNKTP